MFFEISSMVLDKKIEKILCKRDNDVFLFLERWWGEMFWDGVFEVLVVFKFIWVYWCYNYNYYM